MAAALDHSAWISCYHMTSEWCIGTTAIQHFNGWDLMLKLLNGMFSQAYNQQQPWKMEDFVDGSGSSSSSNNSCSSADSTNSISSVEINMEEEDDTVQQMILTQLHNHSQVHFDGGEVWFPLYLLLPASPPLADECHPVIVWQQLHLETHVVTTIAAEDLFESMYCMDVNVFQDLVSMIRHRVYWKWAYGSNMITSWCSHSVAMAGLCNMVP